MHLMVPYTPKQQARQTSASEVYHASGKQGLTTLLPRVGTHGEAWVYATRDMALAALHINSSGGDLGCSVGYYNNQLHICERWPGVFKERYEGRSGSIYVLPGDSFHEGLTSFSAEVVSKTEVQVSRENQVMDAAKYIRKLEDSGQLTIYMFPARPECYPLDDQDLVNKAVRFFHRNRDSVLRYIDLHHPHLIQRVHKALYDAELDR